MVFFRNLAGLGQEVQTHAVDWRGAGLSGRPPFQSKSGQEVRAQLHQNFLGN